MNASTFWQRASQLRNIMQKAYWPKSFCPRLPKSSVTYNHVQSLADPKANFSTQFRLKLETHVEISDRCKKPVTVHARDHSCCSILDQVQFLLIKTFLAKLYIKS